MATDARTTYGRPARIRQAVVPGRVVAFVNAHPVWTVFLLAFAIRAAASVVLAIVHPNNIAPDGIRYSWMAAEEANGHLIGWGLYEHLLYHQTAAFMVPLTGLYALFGAHEIIGQLYVSLLGAATAVFALGIAIEVLPRRWAIAVGLIVALLPSQVVWSALVLKDTAVWFALAGLGLTIAVAGRSRGLRLLALGVIAAAFLVMLGYLRYQTLVVAAWALMLAALLGPRLNWTRRVGGAIAIGVLIPWLVFNLGPAGLTFAANSRAPSDIRAQNAVGAKSSIAPAPAPTNTGPARSTKGSGPNKSGTSATTPRPTASPPPLTVSQGGEVAADVRHLPSGLLAMLVEPYPWQSGGSVYLNLARIATVVWYPLLLLALVGLASLRPRHLRVMAFPLIAGGAILILYALTEGNLGTAFRHRGEFEWVIALLAGFGLARVGAWWSTRRSGSLSAPGRAGTRSPQAS